MARTPSSMVRLSTKAPSFSLPDIHGNFVSLSNFAGKPLLVMFLCNHCPFVKHIRDKLSEIGRDYANEALGIVAINSNDYVKYPEDSPEKMKIEAEEAGYTFPYLLDETQEIARNFGAACTPDFFLFNADHHLVYRGQLDASRPGNNVPVTGSDLSAAINAALKGDAVPETQVPSLGCNIKWK